MPKTPTQPQDKYVLRLPDGLRDRIKAAAADNNRSMNAEIIATLLDAYPAPISIGELVQRTKAAVDAINRTGSIHHLLDLHNAVSEAAQALEQLDRTSHSDEDRGD